MAPIAGVSLLSRVIRRVWEVNQSDSVRSQEEYETGAIVLRLLAQTLEHLRGVTNHYLPLGTSGITLGKERLDAAAYAAFGCSYNKWRERTMLRISAQEWELSRCIPDYDPQQEVVRRTDRRGSLHSLPEKSGAREDGRDKGMQLVPAAPRRKTGTVS